MVQRVTYSRRKSFNTKSNKVRKLNTPGGNLKLHYVGKKGKALVCGSSGCDGKLFGIPALRPTQYSRISKRQKHVSRAYGGSLCATCVRDRIKRNFRMLPVALICILVGFSMCAFFPHPESPGDATICFTIIFLAEFLSSVLYAAKRPRGLLKWLRRGKVVPLMLNCFKIGVLYGLFCDAFKVGS